MFVINVANIYASSWRPSDRINSNLLRNLGFEATSRGYCQLHPPVIMKIKR